MSFCCKVLDPALHAALGTLAASTLAAPLVQGPQAKLLKTESATLLSQYSGMSLSMLDERPNSANSLGSQSGISMQPALANQTSDLGTGQKVVQKHVYSSKIVLRCVFASSSRFILQCMSFAVQSALSKTIDFSGLC